MELKDFFAQCPEVAIGFSGGVDSSYLLYEALKHAKRVKAYYVKTQFQPEFELNDALQLAGAINADMQIIDADILRTAAVSDNHADRCYHCKKIIFRHISKHALADEFHILADGTNASDEYDDRPGMRALAEMQVRSPLRECGITKAQVRQLSRQAGLFTWDKPAYACLATRIPTGRKITRRELMQVEGAEAELAAMGFSDFRVRVFDGAARLQVKEEQITSVLEKKQMVKDILKKYFDTALLDLEGR